MEWVEKRGKKEDLPVTLAKKTMGRAEMGRKTVRNLFFGYTAGTRNALTLFREVLLEDYPGSLLLKMRKPCANFDTCARFTNSRLADADAICSKCFARTPEGKKEACDASKRHYHKVKPAAPLAALIGAEKVAATVGRELVDAALAAAGVDTAEWPITGDDANTEYRVGSPLVSLAPTDELVAACLAIRAVSRQLWGDTHAARSARVLHATPVRPMAIASAINAGLLPVYGLKLISANPPQNKEVALWYRASVV
jgi:hypothetical protein